MTESIEEIVMQFEKMNLTVEQMAEQMKDIDQLSRAGMHLTALSSGNKELANKIDGANKIIEQNKIADFKKAVAEGTQEYFLSQMSWTDKSSLLAEMDLFRYESRDEKPYTSEEQRYQDIIEASIEKDIEKEALSQGFASVEAWREYNGKVLTARRDNGYGSISDDGFIRL